VGRFLVELNMREPEYDALSALMPGFGDSVEAVVQFIVIDWLNKNLGMNWMQQHALVAHTLGRLFAPKRQLETKLKDGKKE